MLVDWGFVAHTHAYLLIMLYFILLTTEVSVWWRELWDCPLGAKVTWCSLAKIKTWRKWLSSWCLSRTETLDLLCVLMSRYDPEYHGMVRTWTSSQLSGINTFSSCVRVCLRLKPFPRWSFWFGCIYRSRREQISVWIFPRSVYTTDGNTGGRNALIHVSLLILCKFAYTNTCSRERRLIPHTHHAVTFEPSVCFSERFLNPCHCTLMTWKKMILKLFHTLMWMNKLILVVQLDKSSGALWKRMRSGPVQTGLVNQGDV